MYFTGFADEAAKDLKGQIRATRELGWENIESRAIDGTNIHDLSDEAFAEAADTLETEGIKINCFGSSIANWGKDIRKPFDIDLEQTERAIKRMQRLGTKLIRIMSYAVIKENGPDDQMFDERCSRLRELVKRFSDAGIQAVHENCMNYGGMGWPFSLKILENVPGLKYVFDTGNPVFSKDRTKPEPCPMQSAWEFYSNVKDYVAYIHIKDGIWDTEKGEIDYSYCGDGDGDVVRILDDAFRSGYDGGISIEPHLGGVFHDPSVKSSEDHNFESYVEYGRRIEKIVADIKAKI